MQPEQATPQQPVVERPVSAAQAPLTPIAQFECWYIPEGKYTIFNYRKSIVMLYPGWMVIYQKSHHAEVARIQLAPDLQMKHFLGFARFAQLNGKKYSFFKFNNHFMTSPIWAYGVLVVGFLINSIEAIGRLNTGMRNIGLQLIALCVILAGFGLLATGIPKARELIAAAKRAAGVVS